MAEDPYAPSPPEVVEAAIVEDTDVEDNHRMRLGWNWVFGETKQQSSPARSSVGRMADPDKTVCFVSIDAGMGSDLLNFQVVKRLEELLPEHGTSGKRMCHLENLSIRYATLDHLQSC